MAMNKDLIIIEQLPVIVTKLKGLSEEIKVKTAEALSLVCSEETVKLIKERRAELNRDKAEIEAMRKEIKKKVLAPYEEFETLYKANITDIYADADKQLKDRIDTVENELKDKKAEKVKSYFEELKNACGIDFISFEDANINITLSASEKSLKEAVNTFIDKIKEDLDIIVSQSYKDEILYEYKKTLKLSDAILTVSMRHQELDKAEKGSWEQQKTVLEQEETKEDKPLSAPTVTAEADEKDYPMTFTVRATRAKLKMVKEFLDREGIYYE